MRFNKHTTSSSLSSLSQKIDHGNVPAAGGIAMSTNTFRTDNNLYTAVYANLAGPENNLYVSYLHTFRHGSSTRLPAMSINITNPHLTSNLLPTSPFAHMDE